MTTTGGLEPLDTSGHYLVILASPISSLAPPSTLTDDESLSPCNQVL